MSDAEIPTKTHQVLIWFQTHPGWHRCSEVNKALGIGWAKGPIRKFYLAGLLDRSECHDHGCFPNVEWRIHGGE